MTKPTTEGAAPAAATALDLPTEFARNRVLSAKQAAEFLGLSLPHFRRQYRAGRVPKPINITERKLGWPIGALSDHVASRVAAEAA